MTIVCPYCENEADVKALHNVTEVFVIDLDEVGGLVFDYVTTYHDGEPNPANGDELQCSECQATFELAEAIALLKVGIGEDQLPEGIADDGSIAI